MKILIRDRAPRLPERLRVRTNSLREKNGRALHNCAFFDLKDIMRTILLFLLLGAHAVLSFAAETTFAWQDTSTYRPPDFDGTFANDPEGAKRLEAAVSDLERGAVPIEKACELLREGLGAMQNRQMPALRGFGNSFIWNKSPQDARAIDLMYHAAGSTNSYISYNAVYFGISTVRPLTDPILRALVDLSMRSEDPNLLSRVAWAGSNEKAKLLQHLQPYLESNDASQRKHAEDLRKIFGGEIKAFAWAAERAKERALEKYGNRLEELRVSLMNGDSKSRRETLDLIHRNRIALIMDESFIPAFAAAAQDSDREVRQEATQIAGGRWIWHDGAQPPAAIDLMLRQSRDLAREVRYEAMYYGLSTIRNRSDEVVERMVEMTLQDGMDNGDVRQRILWGLREEKATLRRVLEKWITGADQIRALFAYGLYLDVFAAQPDALGAVSDLLQNPDKPIAHAIGLMPTAGSKPDSAGQFLKLLRELLPAPYGDRILWPSESGPPFVFVQEPEIAAIKNALIKSPQVKVAMERAFPVEAIIHIGKSGGLKTYAQKKN
jgi:hypothetical protein